MKLRDRSSPSRKTNGLQVKSNRPNNISFQEIPIYSLSITFADATQSVTYIRISDALYIQQKEDQKKQKINDSRNQGEREKPVEQKQKPNKKTLFICFHFEIFLSLSLSLFLLFLVYYYYYYSSRLQLRVASFGVCVYIWLCCCCCCVCCFAVPSGGHQKFRSRPVSLYGRTEQPRPTRIDNIHVL